MATPTPDTYSGAPGTILYGGIAPIDPSAPHQLRIYNWQDAGSPVLVGTLDFDSEIAPMEFEHPRKAAEIGEVPVTQSTQSIVYDGFEFGATRYRIQESLNDVDDTKPVWQVEVAFKPSGRWSTYPFHDTYVHATDSTFPKAFKIQVHSVTGALIHTFEMRDGLAINSPELSQTRTQTKPLRPFVNCANKLVWQSARLKVSEDLNFWLPGVTADSRHAKDAKTHFTTNAAIPLIGGRSQINAFGQWYAAPAWPIPWDAVYGSTPENNAQDPNNDPNLWGPTIYTGEEGARYSWRAQGWRYEPGSISCHDWYPGPGGQRFDRAAVPSVFALYASTPEGVRPRNSEPYRQMAEEWALAYFNNSYYYTRDVKTGAGIPDDWVANHEVSYGYAYYGAGSNYVPGGWTRHVHTHGIPNGDVWSSTSPDKDGLRQWNGMQFDDQHAYSAPGWGFLLLNSPMHVNAQKHRFASSTMAWLGYGVAETAGVFGHRQQAWRWLHYFQSWACATGDHPLGLSQAYIENMMAQELEAIHDNIYVPAIVNNSNTLANKSVRELGIYHQGITGSGGGQTWYDVQTPLWCYIGHVLQLMKTSGMWATMKARNSKCSIALEFVVECMDKWCIDFIVATNGRAEYTQPGDGILVGYENRLSTSAATIGAVTMPTSWANWAELYPATGSESWVRRPNNSFMERYAAQHVRAQWAFIRRDYFADVNPSRVNIDTACSMYDAFYAEWRAGASGGQPWAFRIPAQGILLAPTE